MRKRSACALLVATATLIASRHAMACKNDGTPGPCHCAERMANQALANMGMAGMSSAIITPASATNATIDGDPSGGTTTVHILNDYFSTNPSGQPIEDAVVQIGGTVHWVLDAGFHNVNSVVGRQEDFFSDDLFTIGATFDHEFLHAGSYVYYCNIHGFDLVDGTAGGMAATVTVVAPTWNVDSSGDWDTSANWSGGVPNGVDGSATLGAKITTSQAISANSAITLGSLKFDNANTYQISGSGSVTIDTSTGNGQVSVTQGSHQINVPMNFASNADISVAGGALLNLGGATTISANKIVTKSGDLAMQAPLTVQSGGALQVLSGSTVLRGAPSLASGAHVDVQTNAITVDYSGLGSAAATIASQLSSGYNGGAWNGDGFNTSAAVSNQTGLGWKDDSSNQSILIKYALYGDTDLSGTVDTIDFNLLASNFGQSGKVWADGNSNYSGTVDTIDFNLLAGNFGRSLPASPAIGSLVHEPSSMLLCGEILATGAFARRRKRK